MGLKDVVAKPQTKGLWTWTRGGGWWGPYLHGNEIWVDLHARVLANWWSSQQASGLGNHTRTASSVALTEAQAFDLVCPGLLPGCTVSGGCCAAFRNFSLQSAEAVLRGQWGTVRGGTGDRSFELCQLITCGMQCTVWLLTGPFKLASVCVCVCVCVGLWPHAMHAQLQPSACYLLVCLGMHTIPDYAPISWFDVRVCMIGVDSFMRDDRMGDVTSYLKGGSASERADAVAEKVEALSLQTANLALWEGTIRAHVTDPVLSDKIGASVQYGVHLYAIIVQAWRVMAQGALHQMADPMFNKTELAGAIEGYDAAWAGYRAFGLAEVCQLDLAVKNVSGLACSLACLRLRPVMQTSRFPRRRYLVAC